MRESMFAGFTPDPAARISKQARKDPFPLCLCALTLMQFTHSCSSTAHLMTPHPVLTPPQSDHALLSLPGHRLGKADLHPGTDAF